MAPTLAAAVEHADGRWALSRLAETCASALTIVPANMSALYHLGAPYVESLQQREIRVRACFEAGVFDTGCAHEVTQGFPVPAAVYRVAVTGLGLSSLSLEDERDRQAASTGMGNVAQTLPAINPTIAIDWGDAVNHQLKCATADRAMCDAAAGGAV